MCNLERPKGGSSRSTEHFSRHKVHPIAAVEVELSLWATDILHNDIAKTCAELDIPVVAYSPLGRGALTGTITKFSDIPEGDFRRSLPKYQAGILERNMTVVHEITELSKRRGATPGQVALAWTRTLGNKPGMPTIIPIPGGTTSDKVTQNTEGIHVLSDEEMEEIDRILEGTDVVGSRY